MQELNGPELMPLSFCNQCKGQSVRVSLFDPVYHDRLGRYPGLLARVFPDSIQVDCLVMPPSIPPETAATLELMWAGRLYWGHTQVLTNFAQQPYTLRLALPDWFQAREGRRYPRADTFQPVQCLLLVGQNTEQGVLVSISAGGAALQSSLPLHPGERVSLDFELGTELFFQNLQAEVVRAGHTRSGSWLSGVRFFGLTPGQEQALNEWVKYRLQYPG